LLTATALLTALLTTLTSGLLLLLTGLLLATLLAALLRPAAARSASHYPFAEGPPRHDNFSASFWFPDGRSRWAAMPEQGPTAV